MAVLNPPRVLPGLGRAIVNYLLDARRTLTQDELVAAFKPDGLNPGANAASGVTNTVSALRAIDVLDEDADGALRIGSKVETFKTPFTKQQFRRVLQNRVFDVDPGDDLWRTQAGEGRTRGARDLHRALTWLLAQDALGQPLGWNDNVQVMQTDQFSTTNNEAWAITNDTRWLATVRWILVLGLATTSVVRDKNGVVPLPVIAVDDAISDFPNERLTIHDFLARLGRAIPFVHGGPARSGLVAYLGRDPDAGIRADCADSSIGQALRILEEQGRVHFEALPDADGIRLSRFDSTRQTHVIVQAGGMK
ncbi:protein DpdG [Kribbella sp. NPDC050820]|uniref:protein DpdG n=1 Tax=Kribbella sp. NPDC050820 TaxID=3155408 RepID=UPI0033E0BDBE